MENHTSCFGDIKLAIGVYEVRNFVMTLINLPEPKIVSEDISVKIGLKTEKNLSFPDQVHLNEKNVKNIPMTKNISNCDYSVLYSKNSTRELQNSLVVT